MTSFLTNYIVDEFCCFI